MSTVVGEHSLKSLLEHCARSAPGAPLVRFDDLDCAFIGVAHEMRDAAIEVLVVAHEGAALEARALTARSGKRLARFRVPSQVELRSERPQTPVGKIQKPLLRGEAR